MQNADYDLRAYGNNITVNFKAPLPDALDTNFFLTDVVTPNGSFLNDMVGGGLRVRMTITDGMGSMEIINVITWNDVDDYTVERGLEDTSPINWATSGVNPKLTVNLTAGTLWDILTELRFLWDALNPNVYDFGDLVNYGNGPEAFIPIDEKAIRAYHPTGLDQTITFQQTYDHLNTGNLGTKYVRVRVMVLGLVPDKTITNFFFAYNPAVPINRNTLAFTGPAPSTMNYMLEFEYFGGVGFGLTRLTQTPLPEPAS